mgnify:CR=1 FL=1
MRFRDYNDFEILDLIKSGNEEAFHFMVEKYKYLIAKKISLFQLKDHFDDCFQESLLVLYRSVMKFEDRFGKTFTKYFENNLENHLISTLRKQSRQGKFLNEYGVFYVQESIPGADSYCGLHQTMDELVSLLSNREQRVYDLWIKQGKTVRDCAEILQMKEKQVYNAMDRIRKKLNHLLTS